MRGVATIDRQPDSSTIAVWVTSRSLGDAASNVNAVVIDTAEDPDATEKLRSLTRCCVVLATEGTTLDELPIEGEPLRVADLDTLAAEIAEQQRRIVEAIQLHKARTRSKTLTEPTFGDPVRVEDFTATEDTASARAFALANFAGRIWTSWLRTDDERRKRTVQPKTNASPWIMPEDMNSQTTPDFPAKFAAGLREQALV